MTASERARRGDGRWFQRGGHWRARAFVVVVIALALAGVSSATANALSTKTASRHHGARAASPVRRTEKLIATSPDPRTPGARPSSALVTTRLAADDDSGAGDVAGDSAEHIDRGPWKPGKPTEIHMRRAGSSDLDLRRLPRTAPRKRFRPERELEPHPGVAVPPPGAEAMAGPAVGEESFVPSPSAPAPPPLITFDGLDFATWGPGHPPDTNGDVGPTYYIQTVNTAIGIYDKSNGNQVAAFGFDTFMSQGNFGNLCDTDNFGDPVVLYDSFEDRWVITDFAFQLDGFEGVVNPPGSFQCIAVSKTGDPVSGGWNFYSINTAGGLGDYPKLGIWPDGIYMSVNMFPYDISTAFLNPRVYAFNKAQMYAGAPSVDVVSFDAPDDEFTLLPSNARLQTGTPPLGAPNHFAVVWKYLDVVSVYELHVDWANISTSTFTGPFSSFSGNWWEQLAGANQTAPSPQSRLDELYARLMAQNQYTNIGGVESLWLSQTVGAGNPGSNDVTATQSSVRYYQVKVTGGALEGSPTQAFTYSPADTFWRFMPSVAVDRSGNMALGYTTADATHNPALQYAGRLAGDPPNGITQTEQVMFQGTGSQTTTTRWGDYSAMSLDPDGCTFWHTNEYYAVDGANDLTRIGAFALPGCTPVGGGGTLAGTVTAAAGATPINGATLTLGARTTTSSPGGAYSFASLPAGTYSTVTASAQGFNSQSFTSIQVADSSVTTRDFALTTARAIACLTDTTQADFLTGVPITVDLNGSPGDVKLTNADRVDAQNLSLTNSGYGFDRVNWQAQTFTAGATGVVKQVAVKLFSLGCDAVTMPNLTASIRNTTGNLPSGADLASTTISGFCDGGGVWATFTFPSPVPVTSGTQYAIVWRAASVLPPSTGYAAVASHLDPYSGGHRGGSGDSGVGWTGPILAGDDFGFKVTINSGFGPSGTLVSGLKDANPTPAGTVTWPALVWSATTPANTAVEFQVAGSSSPYGPFSFVGPDGTPATFYTISGASLGQFDGLRYLKYKAYLSTTNSGATPTISSVSTCFADLGEGAFANGFEEGDTSAWAAASP